MNETLDLYLRAHTVVLDQAKRRSRKQTTTAFFTPPKWPDYAVVFGCESRTGVTQELTFGFYRILKLNGDSCVLEEEGGFSMTTCHWMNANSSEHIFVLQFRIKPRSRPIPAAFAL